MALLRKIIHVDMDAFYASVEQRDHPHYRGKPIAVGGSPEQRGAVAAASYEARKYGIHSAMPSRTAVQRCAHLIIVKPRFDAYRAVSQQIRDIFYRYTDLVEPLALDEAYLDVTQNKKGMRSAMDIARAIKRDIRRETQLTASAGVSINKFLAKIASDLNKPDGLCLIAPDQAQSFVEQLPIEQFYGIGKVTHRKMNELGIRTGSDLKACTLAFLVQHFGKAGQSYYQMARAVDDRPVNPNRIRKSVGAEMSYFPDLERVEDLETSLKAIAQRVQERLDRQQAEGYTLTLKIKYADYQQITRSETHSDLFRDALTINSVAQRLLRQNLERDRPVRLLGITISNLARGGSSTHDKTEDSAPVQLCLPFIEP